MFNVNKGEVTNITTEGIIVQSTLSSGDTSRPLKVISTVTEELKKGDNVVYVVFEDESGAILGRL